MVERAARPASSPLRTLVTRVGRNLTTPLLPDDYFALINPRWSKRELFGTVVAIQPETADATTVVIEPSAPWPGHVAGQYVRLGVDLDGIRHWRAYTITSDPDHPQGHLSVTVKKVTDGKVSPWCASGAAVDDIVYLGEPEGTFVLPDPLPERVLMLSAGSGITPIWALLRDLRRRGGGRLHDVVHVHGCHDEADFIYGRPLLRAAEEPGYTLVPHYRAENERLVPADLDRLVPDWRERTIFLSGPSLMIDTFAGFIRDAGLGDRLHLERFQPAIGGDAAVEPGTGGSVTFRLTEVTGHSDGRMSMLEAGEAAGGSPPYGCRMGVCHTCTCTLVSGRVRDLRTGEVHGEAGQTVRTCVNAPEGDVVLDEGHVVMKGTNPRSKK